MDRVLPKLENSVRPLRLYSMTEFPVRGFLKLSAFGHAAFGDFRQSPNLGSWSIGIAIFEINESSLHACAGSVKTFDGRDQWTSFDSLVTQFHSD